MTSLATLCLRSWSDRPTPEVNAAPDELVKQITWMKEIGQQPASILAEEYAQDGKLEEMQWLFTHFRDHSFRAALPNHSPVAALPNHSSVAALPEQPLELPGVDIPHCFRLACASGQLEMAQWLLEHHGQEITSGIHHLWEACANGHLETAQWLISQWQLTYPHGSISPSSIDDRLIWATSHETAGLYLAVADICPSIRKLMEARWKGIPPPPQDDSSDAGSLPATGFDELNGSPVAGISEAVQWISNYQLPGWKVERGLLLRETTTSEQTIDDWGSCLQLVCINSRLDIAQWLVSTFGLTAGDVYSRARADMRSVPIVCSQAACKHGNLEMLQWLTSFFDLQPVDYRATNILVALDLACNGGHFQVAQWMITTFVQTHPVMTEWSSSIYGSCLEWACYHSCPPFAQWIAGTFNTSERAMFADKRGTLCRCLRILCANGNLEMAKWLVATWGVAAIKLDARSDYCLLAACIDDHPQVTQWLAEQLGFNAADGPAGCLSVACASGNLEMAKWWVAVSGLRSEQVNRGDCLRHACASGNVESAQWLVDTFSLAAKTPDASDYLVQACREGRLRMAQWMVNNLGLTVEDVREGDNYCLRESCYNGQLEVVQWLVAAFGLTVEDVRSYNSYCLRHAYQRGHLKLVSWLYTHFQLQPEDAGEWKGHILRLIASEAQSVAGLIDGS